VGINTKMNGIGMQKHLAMNMNKQFALAAKL